MAPESTAPAELDVDLVSDEDSLYDAWHSIEITGVNSFKGRPIAMNAIPQSDRNSFSTWMTSPSQKVIKEKSLGYKETPVMGFGESRKAEDESQGPFMLYLSRKMSLGMIALGLKKVKIMSAIDETTTKELHNEKYRVGTQSRQEHRKEKAAERKAQLLYLKAAKTIHDRCETVGTLARNYLRLLGILTYFFFFIAVLTTVSRYSEIFQMVSSVAALYLPAANTTMMNNRREVQSWLGSQVGRVWQDPVCGNGVCEAPFEFPAFKEYGCRADCGLDLSIVDVVLLLEVDFTLAPEYTSASEAMAPASWNLCQVQMSLVGETPKKKGRSSNVVLHCMLLFTLLVFELLFRGNAILRSALQPRDATMASQGCQGKVRRSQSGVGHVLTRRRAFAARRRGAVATTLLHAALLLFLPGFSSVGVVAVTIAETPEFQSCLGNPSTCTDLFMNNNLLTGTVPTEIGLLTGITGLEVYNNELTGAVPTEIGLLTFLKFLAVFSNALTGTVPTEVGLLTGLQTLWINNNALTGTVPIELGRLTGLKRLAFSQNALTGTVPTMIRRLTSLSDLQIENNQDLCGNLPSGLADQSVSLKGTSMGAACLSAPPASPPQSLSPPPSGTGGISVSISSSALPMVVGGVGGAFVLAALGCFFCWKRWKRHSSQDEVPEFHAPTLTRNNSHTQQLTRNISSHTISTGDIDVSPSEIPDEENIEYKNRNGDMVKVVITRNNSYTPRLPRTNSHTPTLTRNNSHTQQLRRNNSQPILSRATLAGEVSSYESPAQHIDDPPREDRHSRAASENIMKLESILVSMKKTGSYTLHVKDGWKVAGGVVKQQLAFKGIVYKDLKPPTSVKVIIGVNIDCQTHTWKPTDLATSEIDEDHGEIHQMHFTFRYAAPELVQAAVSGKENIMSSAAFDMWSFGVIMYEIYVGKRLFDPSLQQEEITALLCSPGEMELKGLQNVEPNAAQLISKVLVKDPTKRWTAHKALNSQFFRQRDDTTRMASSAASLQATMHTNHTSIHSQMTKSFSSGTHVRLFRSSASAWSSKEKTKTTGWNTVRSYFGISATTGST